MGKNNREFSMEDAMRLAKSPAGQQLLAMLRSQESSHLQQLMQQIKNGDYQSAGSALSSMLSSEKAKELMRQLEDS